tara:strand:- start:130 stop:285 length:156 start_codon:yes stop_codon:yes gene_type:complete
VLVVQGAVWETGLVDQVQEEQEIALLQILLKVMAEQHQVVREVEVVVEPHP